MIRRAYIIGIMTLGLTASGRLTSPVVERFVSSAQNVQQHFRELKNSGSRLSPIERFVFSLILANTASAHADCQAAAPPDERT
jgi:hypothetical protein